MEMKSGVTGLRQCECQLRLLTVSVSGDDERGIKFIKTSKFSPRDSREGQSVASENEQKSQADGELQTCDILGSLRKMVQQGRV